MISSKSSIQLELLTYINNESVVMKDLLEITKSDNCFYNKILISYNIKEKKLVINNSISKYDSLGRLYVSSKESLSFNEINKYFIKLVNDLYDIENNKKELKLDMIYDGLVTIDFVNEYNIYSFLYKNSLLDSRKRIKNLQFLYKHIKKVLPNYFNVLEISIDNHNEITNMLGYLIFLYKDNSYDTIVKIIDQLPVLELDDFDLYSEISYYCGVVNTNLCKKVISYLDDRKLYLLKNSSNDFCNKYIPESFFEFYNGKLSKENKIFEYCYVKSLDYFDDFLTVSKNIFIDKDIIISDDLVRNIMNRFSIKDYEHINIYLDSEIYEDYYKYMELKYKLLDSSNKYNEFKDFYKKIKPFNKKDFQKKQFKFIEA